MQVICGEELAGVWRRSGYFFIKKKYKLSEGLVIEKTIHALQYVWGVMMYGKEYYTEENIHTCR
jgi:hypothetical protein